MKSDWQGENLSKRCNLSQDPKIEKEPAMKQSVKDEVRKVNQIGLFKTVQTHCKEENFICKWKGRALKTFEQKSDMIWFSI